MSGADQARLDARHKALRNGLYHAARKRYYDRWNNRFTLVIILAGASSISEVVRANAVAPIALGVLVTLAGSLQLVYRLGEKSHLHDRLARNFVDIQCSIDKCLSPSDEDVAQWESQISLLAADAPPTLRALDSECYNEASDAMYGSRGSRLHIGWWRRALRHYFAFEGAKFEPRDQV